MANENQVALFKHYFTKNTYNFDKLKGTNKEKAVSIINVLYAPMQDYVMYESENDVFMRLTMVEKNKVVAMILGRLANSYYSFRDNDVQFDVNYKSVLALAGDKLAAYMSKNNGLPLDQAEKEKVLNTIANEVMDEVKTIFEINKTKNAGYNI